MGEIKKCVVCGKELNGLQRKYCSLVCKSKDFYDNNKNGTNIAYRQFIRATKRKLEFIDYKGGCCELCGYKKNIAALDFHHINSNEKEFNIDARVLANSNYEKLKKEVDKCMLLCANCHREIHNENSDIDSVREIIKDEQEILHIKKEAKYCERCGKKLLVSNKTNLCRECLIRINKKEDIYPSVTELYKKYDELKSWQKVADFFGITRKITQMLRNREPK